LKTTVGKPRNTETVKPFQLVKYLSLSSLVVVLVYTVFLSSFISQRAKAILVKKSEQYAFLATENLNHQVFYQFTLATLVTEGEIRLSRQSQFERLDKVVRNAIHGFSIEQVNIYDPQQVLTYSTQPEHIGLKADLGEIFGRALEGETASFPPDEGGSFLGFAWGGGPRKLKTYLPMWVEKPMTWKRGKVIGVFEITQDVTEDYETIHRFQWIVVASSLLFVGIVFLTLLPIARRAERIITGRATERKKLEERLHQAERLAALGEMVAGVSHEIRNPLGIIRSTAELLDSRMENDRHRKLSGIIVEEATRLNDILTEFLDFARPKTLRLSNCRLEDIVEKNLDAIDAECQKRGIVLERHYYPGDYTLQADADLLYRALVNVVANAVQAMPQGGRLRVQTELSNAKGAPQVELRVQDSGSGIPAELQQKVFNPFFTTREKGTGLGLAIVQSIIEGHQGVVEVDSKVGEGTTIIIRLPLSQAGLKDYPATVGP
jgi:two-component system, NtrC family, sensor histidine kinase HydH